MLLSGWLRVNAHPISKTCTRAEEVQEMRGEAARARGLGSFLQRPARRMSRLPAGGGVGLACSEPDGIRLAHQYRDNPRACVQRRKIDMDRRFFGVVLLVAGILALVYRGFTYTRETSQTEIGPVEIQVHDREWVNIPLWAGIATVVVGASLLLPLPQKSR